MSVSKNRSQSTNNNATARRSPSKSRRQLHDELSRMNLREWWDHVGTENARKVADAVPVTHGYFKLLKYGHKRPSGEVALRIVEAALPDYMRFANIREMHTMSAVGVAKQADVDDKGLFIGVKVVDDTAWTKVKEGVYKGFSVGGRALEKVAGVINKMRLTEISLVDRPANPECVFDTWKADSDGAEAITLRVPADVAKAIGQLSDEQVAAIIKAGVTVAALPAAEPAPEPAAEPAPVTKGLWNAQRLIDALGSVNSACESCDYETRQGEHSEELNAAMKAALAALGEVAQRYLGEEIAAMLSKPKAAGEADGDIQKKGARYSKATKEALAKVHGMLRECDKAMSDMGYEAAEDDDTGKAAVDSPLLAKAEAEVTALMKAAGMPVEDGAFYGDILKAALVEVKKGRDRIKELEAKPGPAPARMATAVAKAGDTEGNAVSGGGDNQSAPTKQSDDPLALLKAAHRNPMPAERLGVLR